MELAAVNSRLESLTIPLPAHARPGRPGLGAINTRRVDLYLDQAEPNRSGNGFALQVADLSTLSARGEAAALAAESANAKRDANASTEALLSRLPDDVRAEVSRYLNGEVDADYYSPERTADRITSFVIGGFARFEGGAAAQENSAEARQRFVDFITPAIDKGFKQALDILEPLHEGVKERVQDTRDLIGTRMAAFVEEEHVDTVA